MKVAFFSIILFSQLSLAGIGLPRSLSGPDRQEITEVIGLGSSSKLLSDPYPLGGYSGVELGFQMESINVDDINRLGATQPKQKDFYYPKFSIGKGLYNNVDVFFHFAPFTQNVGFSEYGGILRVVLHQAAFLPATFSLLVHTNSTNLGNVFYSQSRGADLVAGINVGNFALYIGGGKVEAAGQFSRDITNTGGDENNFVGGFHSFLGGSFDYEPIFVAFQVDEYTQAVFSSRIGVRF